MEIPSFREDHISQIPALQLLQKLGYKYLSPEEEEKLREKKKGLIQILLTEKRLMFPINN